MVSWPRCLHMGAGSGPLGRDLPSAAGRETLLIPVSLLDSWADLRPAHVTLYCDILLHHWPSLGFHNSLGKAREAYVRWKSTEGRGYSTMYSSVWTQRRHQPFSNLEHKDNIGNSSLIPIRFKLESQRAGKSSWREAMAPRWQGGESADNWAKDSRKGRRGKCNQECQRAGFSVVYPGETNTVQLEGQVPRALNA